MADFANLLNQAGWKMFASIIQYNIDLVTDQILTGGRDERELDSLRKKREAYVEMLETPVNEIKKLESDAPEVHSDDPFDPPTPTTWQVGIQDL